MESGLYERLVDAGLARALDDLDDDLIAHLKDVPDADLRHVVSRHVASALVRQITPELANQILAGLDDEDDAQLPPGKTRQLVGIERKVTLGTRRSYATRPTTPLSEAALLTNSHGEPSLGAELRAELVSADSVDLLCAFVMWPGIRLLEDELRTLRAHNVPSVNHRMLQSMQLFTLANDAYSSGSVPNCSDDNSVISRMPGSELTR